MVVNQQPYRGRFAPSPTGPLHLGSLIAAVGSYLDAHANQGEWLVRIEDIDPPREVPGAADAILDTLEVYGFIWHGEVIKQSQRHAAYHAALEALAAQDLSYTCYCSRKDISQVATHRTSEGWVYPNTCRPAKHPANHQNVAPERPMRSTRLIATGTEHTDDLLRGPQHTDYVTDCGDFVLQRADGYFSYQLAVAVDDMWQGITHVIRGVDLLGSSPKQRYIMRCFNHTPPHYGHLPLILNTHGDKLSKQNFAVALPHDQAPIMLWLALDFLGQQPPTALRYASVDTLWQWAKQHWSLAKVNNTDRIYANNILI